MPVVTRVRRRHRRVLLPRLLLACAVAAGGPAAADATLASNCSVPVKPCPVTAHRTFCPTNPDKKQCSEAPCDSPRQPCPAPFQNGTTWCPTDKRVPKAVQCDGGYAGPRSITIHTDNVTHQISPLAMGCHSDSGYEHQARGFYAQMIVGASFNSTGFPKNSDGAFGRSPGWNLKLSDPSVSFVATTDPTALFHGVASEKLTLSSTGSGGVSNRGLSNAGMVYKGGKSYDGFIFARIPAGSAAPVVVHVSLEDYVSNKTLATQALLVGGTGEFVRYNFTLTPSSSTGCVDIPPGSDPTIICGTNRQSEFGLGWNKPVTGNGHTCVRCAGEFKISLTSPGAVLINYVYLQPGQWGRLPNLPVLKSAAELLTDMGIKAIRQGGSYASSPSASGDKDYYQWERWTGPAWTRPSRSDGVWQDCLLSGWVTPAFTFLKQYNCCPKSMPIATR